MATHPILARTNIQDTRSLFDSPVATPKMAQVDVLHSILPAELLSYIFTLGEQAERFAVAKQRSRHVRFQELVSQVCSHWRAVAINNPLLWTWIVITRPSHFEVAASYLVRAGPTAPLDIDIEMRSGFWNRADISPTDWSNQLGYTYNLIEFLKARGANPRRWRTLSIWARQPEPLFQVIRFLHKDEAPTLQRLSLKWASKKMQHAEESRALGSAMMPLQSPVLAPNLRHVECSSVPWAFILHHPTPLFTGLTSLSLTAATRLDSTTKLTYLLRENPLLQSLHLSSGPDDIDHAYVSHHVLPCVCLSSLHSLSVHSAYYSDWILHILKAVQVPNLAKFTLATELYTDYPGEATGSELMLLNYLSGGDGDAYIDRGTSGSEIKSIYPSLRELDVSSVGCHSGGKTMLTLLSSFPSVTQLSIASHQIDCLGRFPWVLPKLNSLNLNGYPYPDLGKVLRHRTAAGHPIRMVELRDHHSWDPEDRDAYLNALPVGVTTIEHSESECVLDDDESAVEYWEDEVGDEEAEEYFDTGEEWMEGAEVDLTNGGSEDEGYEEYEEGEVYELSDEYEGGYPEDVYLPTCWIDEDAGASEVCDTGLGDLGGPSAYSDSNPVIEEGYSDGEQAYEWGYYEGDVWGGYEVDNSDGGDLGSGGSAYGDYNNYEDYDGDYGDDD